MSTGRSRKAQLSNLTRVACYAVALVYAATVVPLLPRGSTASFEEGPSVLILAEGLLVLGFAALALSYTRSNNSNVQFPGRQEVFDAATGLHNRRYIVDLLGMELRRATRHHSSFSVVLLQFQRDSRRDSAATDLPVVAAALASKLPVGNRIAVLRVDELIALPLSTEPVLDEGHGLSTRVCDQLRIMMPHPEESRVRLRWLSFGEGASDPVRVIDGLRAEIRRAKWRHLVP